MNELSFDEALELIRAKDPRYAAEAYHFVREALDYTQKDTAKETSGSVRHVTGQELLAGIRAFALTQFGPMAMLVLAEWGVHSCTDFGEIVFNMVEKGILGKTEQDSREDFKDGYDFDEVFVKPYQPLDRQTSSRHVNAHANSGRFRDKNRSAGSEKLSSGSN